ncbi:MAG: cytochrome c-type biogenesis protein CcmH [Immundisolibacteraceae bacterium]|nr:cytochrome c-type biogenesis protein CcmH [Immundisolibacteraceae bacterium]
MFFFWIFCVTGVVNAEIVRETARQREVLDIAEQLRCAVCQSQSVAESDSDLANEMKAIIDEQLETGAAADEIIDYFVDRYGDYILMKPSTDGPGWLLWWLPLMILALVITIVGWQIRVRSKRLVQADAANLEVSRDQQERLQQLRGQQNKEKGQ